MITPNFHLLLAATPYLGIAFYDFLLHPRRYPPALEVILHGLIFLLIAAFLVASILGSNFLAAIALVLAVPLMTADELGFHKNLPPLEKRVHSLAFMAFTAYAVIWIWSAAF